MGLLNSALHIGRSALLSYQGALQVTGNNISSVGSPDYTRLTPELDPLQGNSLTRGLQPGAGVALSGIQRNFDEALESRIRLAIGGQESALTQQASLSQVEVFFDDISGTGASARLQQFFHGFDELQNTPEDPAIRDLAINNAVQLAGSLQALRRQLAGLGADLDGQIASVAAAADQAAREVAGLNEQITRAEAGGPGQATGLRDQRDALLRELSEIFDLTVREEPDGAINVYVGSEALVQGATARGLITVEEFHGEFARSSVRFVDSNADVAVRGGRLFGLMMSRDEHAYGRIAAIDELASAIIAETNRVHADGQGLAGFRSVTGSYEVLAPDAALDGAAAGLPYPPRDGSFFITVSDDLTGTPVAFRIDVALGQGGGTTLQSLVADFNTEVDGVTASITSDQRLLLTADDGFSFTFGHDGQQARTDTSGVLSALGINTLFIGNGARDIAVNPALLDDPRLLAAGATFHTGDGLNAGRIADLDSTGIARLGGYSVTASYAAIANRAALTAAAAHESVDAASSVLSSLDAQKQSISGVSLDEEAIALVKFERSFQGASRFVAVVDQLLGELVTLIR